MATLQASSLISSSSSCRRQITRATINIPTKLSPSTALSLPNLTSRSLVEELELTSGLYRNRNLSPKQGTKASDPAAVAKLYAIMEAVADRAEMHRNMKEQRENWNSLLLNSINAITLTAAAMAGIAAANSGAGAHLVALSSSSTLLYLAATGMLMIMNKIQPSQLTEEQRNAARLFQKLRQEIQTKLAIGNPNSNDVKEAMEKVQALDKAYPLPLIGVMLEKFPATVEPAKWWPEQRRWRQGKYQAGGNGWDVKLEERMRGLMGVLRTKDKEDYLRLGEKALRLNKILAISGPLLTGLAAFGSALMGSALMGQWAVVLGVVAGALASVVNTVEHGGQVGMVFEMYRSNAGFFDLMEESIEANLKERKENGELFEMKVALELGRNLSELREFADSSLVKGEANVEEFASKLF